MDCGVNVQRCCAGLPTAVTVCRGWNVQRLEAEVRRRRLRTLEAAQSKREFELQVTFLLSLNRGALTGGGVQIGVVAVVTLAQRCCGVCGSCETSDKRRRSRR